MLKSIGNEFMYFLTFEIFFKYLQTFLTLRYFVQNLRGTLWQRKLFLLNITSINKLKMNNFSFDNSSGNFSTLIVTLIIITVKSTKHCVEIIITVDVHNLI